MTSPRFTCSHLLAESWAPRLIEQLEYANVGVLMCVLSLLMGIVKKDSKGYEAVVKVVIKLLHKVRWYWMCDVNSKAI